MVIAENVPGVSMREELRRADLHRSARPDGGRDLSQLKILIVSTPKTGNTWVKQLLSTIYDLPVVLVGNTLDSAPETLEGLGERWIAHQHWVLTPNLLRWGRENGLVFVTTIRHPGDTLVSLYHFLRSYANAFRDSAGDFVALMNLDRMAWGETPGDGKKVGKHLLWYVQEQFLQELEQSLLWMRAPETLPVRYEDLWRDPLSALTQLTARISPVSRDCIERAIEACDIGLMRSLAERDRDFFRQGGVGGWRTDLPPETLAVLRKVEPYPTYSALLGYTFDLDDPLTTAPAKARTFHNPFRGVTHFDTGVPVAPILARLYLTFPSTVSAQWTPVTRTTSENSFFAWANAPADHDPSGEGSLLRITNLAAYIHHIRPELRREFPDPFGADRRAYARWFIVHAQKMYALDRAFITPILEGIRDWLNAPTEEDPRRDESALVITNIALYLYQIRHDLHAILPDVFGRHRLPFARWFVEFGRVEFSLDGTLMPLTVGYTAREEHAPPMSYAWLETLHLVEEAFAEEREATRRYLTTIEEDRANIRTYLADAGQDQAAVRAYLADVDRDRTNVRAYLEGIKQDRDNVRAYLESVEQDRATLRDHLTRTLAYLEDVEQDRTNLRTYLADVERDRDDTRAHLMRVEEDRANMRKHLAAVEADDRAVRAYLKLVEQDRTDVRAYLTDVEQDRANVRAYVADVQRDYARMSGVAATHAARAAALEASVQDKERQIDQLRREMRAV